VVVVVVVVVVLVVVVVVNYSSMSKPQGPDMPDSKFHYISVHYFVLKRLSNSEIKYKIF
jgi:hypothetical protein